MVLGLEADLDGSSFHGLTTFCSTGTGGPLLGRGVNCETSNNKLEQFSTVRGRVGYSWDRWLPYFTGGVAFGDIDANRTGFGGSSDTNAGWTVGFGLEGVIANRWTAKLEYLYADIGDTTCSAAACGTATNVDLRMSIVRAGLNYRF